MSIAVCSYWMIPYINKLTNDIALDPWYNTDDRPMHIVQNDSGNANILLLENTENFLINNNDVMNSLQGIHYSVGGVGVRVKNSSGNFAQFPSFSLLLKSLILLLQFSDNSNPTTMWKYWCGLWLRLSLKTHHKGSIKQGRTCFNLSVWTYEGHLNSSPNT